MLEVRPRRPPSSASLYPDGTNDWTQQALDSARSGLGRLWTQQALDSAGQPGWSVSDTAALRCGMSSVGLIWPRSRLELGLTSGNGHCAGHCH